MKISVPSKKTRERFLIIYELEGCQTAVDFLTKYYKVRPMRIRLDNRKVGNGSIAVYCWNKAYFTRRGLNKRTILHELYHHLVCVNKLEMSERQEEKDANSFARAVLGNL
jgi:hypothetical protein